MRLDAARTITATAQVAAHLPQEVASDIGQRPYSEKPYWHIERARLVGSQLSDVWQNIEQLEDELAERVANDLDGKQAKVEQEMLARNKPPSWGPWYFTGPFACPKNAPDRAAGGKCP